MAHRVLAVIDTLEVGGAQQHLFDLAGGMAARGFDLTIASSGPVPPFSPFAGTDLSVLSLDARPITHRVSPAFAARLAGLLASHRFDLVHAHLHGASVSAALAVPPSGTPLVITQHSMGTWRGPLDRAWSRWAAARAAGVIAVAGNVADRLRADRRTVHLVPNGVHLPRLPGPADIAGLRAALGIAADAYVIGFAGRLVPDKDPLLFVEVAARVAARCPRAHFIIAGGGPLRPQVEERIRRLELERRCTLTGVVPGAGLLMAALDVLLLTSRSEAAPLVVLEAMAAQRPVIAAGVGDVPLQIEQGLTGLVVPRDPQTFAEAVFRLSPPDIRRRMGAAGRERVAGVFSVDRMVMETAQVYQQALNPVARPEHLVRAQESAFGEVAPP